MTRVLLFANRLRLHFRYSATILLVSASFIVRAANISSTATGGNWSATGTWVGGVVPGSADVAIVVSGATVTVDISTAVCNALDINTGATGGGAAATLSFASSGALTVGGTVTIGASGGGHTGSIDMTSGGTLTANGFTITRAGTWTVGTGTVALASTNTLPANFFTTFYNLSVIAGTTTTGRTLTVNNNLSISDGADFTLGAFALTVTGTTTIGGGTSGTMTISSATGVKTFVGLITLNAGADWNNSGNSNVTVEGGITNNGTFTSGTGVYTFSTNNQVLTGTLSINSITVTAISLTNTNTLTVATALSGTGGLIQAVNAILNIGGTSAITTLTSTASPNTVNYTGNAQTLNANDANYYLLTLSGTGTDVLPAVALTIASNMTLSGTVTTTTRAALTVNGNLTTGDGTTFTAAAFNLTIVGSTTIGAGTSGSFVISSATGTKTFEGPIRINAGASWMNTGNSAVTIENGMTYNGSTFTGGTGVYTFSTNNQTITGTLTIPSLTVTGITLINGNTLTVSTALAGSGDLQQATNASLILNGTSAIITLDATTNSGNTVTYSGAAQTVNGTNYYNLILGGTGAKTLQAGTATIAANLTMSGTATTTTVNSLTISGNLSIGNTNTFTAAGFPITVTGTTSIGAGTGGNLTINSNTGAKTFVGLISVAAGATWGNTGNSAVTIEGGITNSGTFTSGNGIYTFSSNNQALTGTFTITNVTVTGITLTNNNTLAASTTLSGTGTLSQAANATLNIGNGSTITTLTATASGNTVNYTRGGAQTINGANYNNLGLSGSGLKTLQTGTTNITGNFTLSGTARTTGVVGLTIGGNLTIGTGTTFTAGNFSHSIAGNFTNNATFTSSNSLLTFNGTSAQTIGGTAASTFYDLAIDNNSGVTMNDGTNSVNKTVTDNLNLQAGYLTTTTSNLLILNNGATSTVTNAALEAGGGSLVPQYNSPYVNGPMRKIGNQAFIFPVGVLGTGAVPIGISAPATVTDAFDGTYVRASAETLGSISSATLIDVSICDYWTLNHTTGTSTITVTAFWNQNSPCNGEASGAYVNNLTNIALAHFNGTNWNANSTALTGSTIGTTVAGGIAWSGVSNFSPFALGNINGPFFNPLPINLFSFNATRYNGYNQVSWKAACATATNQFEVQRSADGISFENIDTVLTTDATDCSANFYYNDYSPFNQKVYYRLRTTDGNGKIGYSDIVLISSTPSAVNLINVYPNPVQDNATLKISATQNENVELAIYSLDGKELYRSRLQVLSGDNQYNLPTAGLAHGVYIIRGIFEGGQTSSLKLIKN
jgi:hypothetical protein